MNGIRTFVALVCPFPLSLAQMPPRPADGAPLNSAGTLTAHIPLERVIMQGQRGVGCLAEENTLEPYLTTTAAK